MAEIYFELLSAGAFHEDGYVVQGGPGRAIFDQDTKAFLRMEPLGGASVVVAEQPAPRKTKSTAASTDVAEG